MREPTALPTKARETNACRRLVPPPIPCGAVDGTRIVLLRHGESLAQERRIVGGHKGCAGLSERGRRQVEALADRLRRTGELTEASALYASIMPRAVETASIIAGALGMDEVRQDCDFCEHHPGEGDGLDWDEFDRRYPAPEGWDPHLRRDPGGETWAEMAERVARGLDTLVDRHAGSTVVVACHGGVVIQSMMRWLGLEVGGGDRAWLSPVNSSMTEWRFGPNPFLKATLPIELVRFNDHAHLAGVD
jgi:broad specificity phosphatase PhoE